MINQPILDLWPDFVPLWIELNKIAPGFQLAGGYGLFLKQRWLLTEPAIPVLVPLEHWHNSQPRATRDLDVIVELDFIASRSNHEQIDTLFKAQGFSAVPGRERWKFERKIEPGRTIILDLLAPKPDEARTDLQSDGSRVKPRPRLKSIGIHGHQNTEIVGNELYTLTFTLDDAVITVPNPVTYAIMKMVAARDRLYKSRDPEKGEEARREEEGQARKHTEDVYRVLAMMTLDESDRASEILAEIRTTLAYQDACSIYIGHFAAADSWGSQNIAAQWTPEDFTQMQGVLASWFSPISNGTERE